ncbi:MAG: U32 family peptidase [Rhodospirillaceae bacterium]|jgi:O2-independent ubiquinone biosynthesis protein UbiV|nr:U32 family peptidase [Rhodospirillaceae bacterium]MBT4464660.1 U32 family peptidase [Rhodospirillaceae bacterium]MBT5013094.1 U32 family peptidase [Rhodospirillaceae bacterium]MBT5308999.1 U32 family peptidase [Rhodospirillaceae bacterium]MBT6406233.1 U32 family peptidase [Rhodospirillaceae bacterium]
MNTTLVMGPVLFNWTPEDWRDFHFRMADEADVDVVCVGEVVCSKRAPFFEPYMADVIERLLAADKQVILSTLALIMNKREMKSVRDTAAIDEDNIIVEANDVSAVALLGGRPHAVGPFVNVYNEGTLAYLARNGARSVCLPVELGMDALGALAKDSPAELEVMVFGRLPLAISARCYHARAHGLHKDGCQYVCIEDADGMEVETLDGEPFLAINGVQTLSHAYTDLSAAVPDLLDLGIRRLRLSPHASVDMVAVSETYRAVIDGKTAPDEASERLSALAGDATFCNGYINNQTGYTFS